MDMHVFGNIAQFVGSCTLVYSYFPQIYRLVKERKAEGMNLQFWTILTLGLICIGINLTIADVNYFIQGTQWFNALLAFIVLMLSIKYKRAAKAEKAQKAN